MQPRKNARSTKTSARLTSDMGKISWYVNRLKAMSTSEIFWRLDQKRLEFAERIYGRHYHQVDSDVFDSRLSSLRFDGQMLGLHFGKTGHTCHNTIRLLGGFDYQDYKTKWHSGFQTDNEWERVFSYRLNYKQRDDIGDARTNWELNRHYQFAILAKNYYCTGDEKWAEELTFLFDDWNKENPFLIGISWTSVMEIAIRSLSWCFCLAYLKKTGKHSGLQKRLENGIVNMTDYVSRHHSRFSSANNHLIIEAASMAIAGYCFDHRPWKDKALSILTTELPKQNTKDGVNKEMSLHYQVFVMEAYALTAHCMQANGDDVPEIWKTYLDAMCQFVCHSTYGNGPLIEFGDDDEGKVIDLEGGSDGHHVEDVMQFCSLILGKRYTTFGRASETLRCLYGDGYERAMSHSPLFDTTSGHHFAVGGYTFLRSADQKTLIGIDHAPLGFGTIAAHGHADALSFQMMEDGEMLLADPGTYIYHCDLPSRNSFRKTINHNTLCIGSKDQSEMLGAFLWGKKAECQLLNYQHNGEKEVVEAQHNGYHPVTHKRLYTWDGQSKVLRIEDSLSQQTAWALTFVVGEGCEINALDDSYKIIGKHSKCLIRLPEGCLSEVTITEISTAYGIKRPTNVLRAYGQVQSFSTIISII